MTVEQHQALKKDPIQSANFEMEQEEQSSQQQERKNSLCSFDTKTILRCLSCNELGDSEIFKDIFRGGFVYDKTKKCWYKWSGHVWGVDKLNMAFGAVEGVAKVYEQEAVELAKELKTLEETDPQKKQIEEQRKEFSSRVKMLRSKNRRENILFFAHSSIDPIAVTSEVFDQKPYLLACQNGVIDLKTAEITAGIPDDYLTLSCNTEYYLGYLPVIAGQDNIRYPDSPDKHPCQTWEKTLLEIFSGDVEIVNFFQRVCGSALIGAIVEKKAYLLTGSRDNGKTLIFETLKDVLGQYATSFKRELLLENKKATSAKDADPEIIKLIGKRFAFTSELNDRDKIDSAKFKSLTGSDSLSARDLYETGRDAADSDFNAQHTFFIGTNALPKIDPEDSAAWGRVCRIHLDLNFVDEPEPDNPRHRKADKNLRNKLKKEYKGILAWLVLGCLDYQERGLMIPEKVKNWTNEYKMQFDYIGEFIKERCYVGKNHQEQSSLLYEGFCKWWNGNYNINNPLSNKRFTQMLKARGFTSKTQHVSYIVGLCLQSYV